MESYPKTTKLEEGEKNRNFLVIACGRKCENHPHERWVSIDRSKERNPDIHSTLEQVRPEDFDSITNDHQFQVVFVEGITAGINEERFDIIQKLLNKDGALIAEPCSPGLLWCYAKNEIPINSFIFSKAGLLIVQGNQSIDDIIHIILQDLPNSILNKVCLKIYDQMKMFRNSSEFQNLNPILISVLAHIHAYKDQRNDRFFRNRLKDSQYDTFYQDITNLIFQLQKGEIEVEAVKSKLDAWGERLPSTSKPLHKLTYDPLKIIIDACKLALDCYPTSKQLEVKSSLEIKNS